MLLWLVFLIEKHVETFFFSKITLPRPNKAPDPNLEPDLGRFVGFLSFARSCKGRFLNTQAYFAKTAPDYENRFWMVQKNRKNIEKFKISEKSQGDVTEDRS